MAPNLSRVALHDALVCGDTQRYPPHGAASEAAEVDQNHPLWSDGGLTLSLLQLGDSSFNDLNLLAHTPAGLTLQSPTVGLAS